MKYQLCDFRTTEPAVPMILTVKSLRMFQGIVVRFAFGKSRYRNKIKMQRNLYCSLRYNTCNYTCRIVLINCFSRDHEI